MAKNYNIAVMPGDGTGPEVVAEGVKVLKAAADKFGFKLDLVDYDLGGERYLKTGETLPDEARDEFLSHPKIGVLSTSNPSGPPK